MSDEVMNQNPELKQGYESTLRFREEVVSKIVGYAVEEIEGILAMSGSFFTSIKESFGQSDKTKGVSVDMEEDGVIVNLEMVMEYGKSAPEIFEQLKELVSERINYMTGLSVLALNVRVVDILMRSEFQAKRSKKQKEEEQAEALAEEPSLPIVEAEFIEQPQDEQGQQFEQQPEQPEQNW